MSPLLRAGLAALLFVVSLGALAGEQELLVFDYESEKQGFENANKLQFVAEHATQGTKAGKAVLTSGLDTNIGFWGGQNYAGKWGEYDQFVIDAFVEGGPVKLVGFARDKEGQDWWKRHNFEIKLQPGKRRIAFSLGAFTRQNGNGSLDLKTMDFMALRFESEDAKQPATIYLDNARLIKGSGNFEVKVIYSFEGQDAGQIVLEDYPDEFKGKSAMAPVEERASHGKKALKLESRAPAGNVQFTGFDGDWSKYDSLAMDIFNATDKPQSVAGWIRAVDPKSDWWNRHNYERILKPGFNTVKFALGGMATPAKTNTPIDLTKLVSFNISVNQATVFIDNIRLIKGVEEVPVAGLKKFDFGPANSALMPGFTKISSKDPYAKEKGFGWLPAAQFGRDFDMNEMLGRHRPPDDLCRDFLMPLKATFAIDVPDGIYGVWLMLGPPANGWGPSFTRRTVTAGDKVVVDDVYDLARFKAHEFTFQDYEDLPGDDLWERYINPLFKPSQFDVEVKGGQLQLTFDSHSSAWSAMLNGLVVWPKASENDAVRWLANLSDQRKEQYQALHVEKLPEVKGTFKPTEQDTARGYVRFIHSPDADINVNSLPAPREIETTTLDLAAAPGEYEDGCIGIHPLKDCGVVKISVTDLAGPGGAIIPAAATKAMVLRYKAQNQTAVYLIAPKYLDVVPAEGIDVKNGVTRSFWLVTQVPQNAAPGKYTGQVRLAFAGKGETVPYTLTVYPIKLEDPDFPMAMFGMGPMQSYHRFDGTGESHRAAFKEVIEDAREHGLTSLDPHISIPLKGITNGKAEVDFSGADRFMELARAAGFKHELNGYSVSTGFPISFRNNVDFEGAAKKFGVSNYGELVKAYFDAVREHAKEKNWLPIAFCTDDEYIVHPGGEPSKLAAHHKVLQENAPGFHFVAFDSAYLGRDPKRDPEIAAMFSIIDTWGAGLHNPKEAEVIKKAGRRLWLYNTGMNRFTFGTYMSYARAKYDVKGFFQWVYSGGGTYGNFYLASHNEAHYGVVYPSTRGLRPTPVWERIRAGCDDHKYIDLATKLIKRAKAEGKGAAEAKELESVIETTYGKLTFGNMRADALDGQGKADNPFSPESMENFKRTVATGIVKLEQALK
jgi:hypothetical protein